MKTFCGIDIGLKGGLAVIDENCKILKLLSLQTKKNQQGKEELNAAWLYENLPIDGDLQPLCSLTTIEALKSFGNEGRTSLWSFGTSNGKTLAILEITNSPYIAIDPKIWKEKYLKGTKKDKSAAIGYVLQRFPGVDLKQGKSQFQDGLADALMLALYSKDVFTNDCRS